MINKKALLVLASAVVFAACGNQDANKNDANNDAANDTKVEESANTDKNEKAVKETDQDTNANATNEDMPTYPEVGKTLEEAIDAFYEHFGDKEIELEDAELDLDDNKYSYKIQGFKDGEEYEAAFDADTLDLIGESQEADDDAEKLALDLDNIIPAKEAMEKAIEGQAEGAYVKEYELTIENNKGVYEIDVENGDDVVVDAASGEIIEK